MFKSARIELGMKFFYSDGRVSPKKNQSQLATRNIGGEKIRIDPERQVNSHDISKHIGFPYVLDKYWPCWIESDFISTSIESKFTSYEWICLINS